MARSDLPFGSEFSPAQIDLPVLLEMAHDHAADWKAFENAVRDRYFEENKTSDYNKGKLANNTKLSMRAYGLIGEKDSTLTETGQTLFDVRADEVGLYEAFARHILKDCQGMNFVQCLLDMWAAGRGHRLEQASPLARRTRHQSPSRREAHEHDAAVARKGWGIRLRLQGQPRTPQRDSSV